jgi:hypothetical protein
LSRLLQGQFTVHLGMLLRFPALPRPLSQCIRAGLSFLYHHRLYSGARKTLCSHRGSACCRAVAAASSVLELTTTLVERPLIVGNIGIDVASGAPEIAN